MVDLEPKTVRLSTDDMDRVAEFQEREGCTEAEAFRRLLRAGLEAEGITPEPVADGSGTIRRSLNIVTGIGLSVGILAWILSFASVPTLLYTAYSITGLLMAIASMLLNYTSIPESIDRIIYDLIPRGVY